MRRTLRLLALGKAWFGSLPSVLITGWLVGAILTGIILPRLGTTYALYSDRAPQKQGGYITLSGDTAFQITTPVPANLGNWARNAKIPSTLVLTIVNITNNYPYPRTRNFTDLNVTLVQDPGAQISVTLTYSHSLNAGASGSVFMSGKAGNTTGTIHGYFHITALNGFISLDVPALGTVGTGLLAASLDGSLTDGLDAASGDCLAGDPETAVPTGDPAAVPDGAALTEEPAPTPCDPSVAPADASVVPDDASAVPDDPSAVPDDASVVPADASVVPTDPAPAADNPSAAPPDSPAPPPDAPAALPEAAGAEPAPPVTDVISAPTAPDSGFPCLVPPDSPTP